MEQLFLSLQFLMSLDTSECFKPQLLTKNKKQKKEETMLMFLFSWLKTNCL